MNRTGQKRLRLLLLIGGLFIVADAEPCDTKASEQGCTVNDAHAQCESSELAASIEGLPPCTTRITFLLTIGEHYTTTKYHVLSFKRMDFSNLTKLEELTIYTNRRYYAHVRIKMDSLAALTSLKSLKTLRINVNQVISIVNLNDGVCKHMKSLEVLDLTRGKPGLSAVSFLIGRNPSMKKLVLKNVQQIDLDHEYTPTVDLARFVCGKNVRYLDLSYNDIIAVNSSLCIPSKVRYLNLDHNLLVSSPLNGQLVLTLLSLTGLEKFTFNTWSGVTYQEGLWDSPPEYYIDEDDKAGTVSLLSKVLLHSPFSFLAGYGSWVEDVLFKHCGNNGYTKAIECLLSHTLDACAFMQCVNPVFDVQACRRLSFKYQLAYFVETSCDYSPCVYNVTFPFPPQLREIHSHNLFKFSTGQSTLAPTSRPNGSIVCVHPHNNLEVIDIPNMKLLPGETFLGEFGVSGLHKIKYINLQGHQLPILLDQLVVHDMFGLTELHIGGGPVAHNNTLPAFMFQSLPKLAILNLSNAELIGIHPHAFIQSTSLSVLDLSYNHLDVSSLSFINWSQTKLKSLNLSHNHLTAIPEMMRWHLDEMEGLELYLSGNTFICNCENLAFLQWVQTSRSITFHYSGDHVCRDSPGHTIHNIEIDSLHCNWYWMQPLIIVLSSLGLIGVIGAAVWMYKKRWFISNMIFRLQERFRPAIEEQSSISYRYDAFVLYSSVDDDRLWVHYKMVSELEKIYGFRLCIHHRDFLAGCDIIDNIEQAIRVSRKVLVVMSENFLRSDWCIEEVQMTSSIDRKKFVVIMYKDVLLSGVHIPLVVQHLLESITYVEWQENPQAQDLFWKKLRRALHSKQKVKSEETQNSDSNVEQSLLL